MAHQDSLLADVAKISDSRDRLVKEIQALGLEVVPSDANFILFTGFKKAAADVWQSLVDAGVLIRDVGIPKHLRITVGTESENQAFIAALSKVI